MSTPIKCPKCRLRAMNIVADDGWYRTYRCYSCGETMTPFRLPPKFFGLAERAVDEAELKEKLSAENAIDSLNLPKEELEKKELI